MEKFNRSKSKTALSEADVAALFTNMDLWDELEQLGEKIGANWQLDINSVELITLLRDEET